MTWNFDIIHPTPVWKFFSQFLWQLVYHHIMAYFNLYSRYLSVLYFYLLDLWQFNQGLPVCLQYKQIQNYLQLLLKQSQMSDNFEITDGVINMLYDQRTKNEAQQTQLGTLPSSSLNESQSFFKEEDDRQGQYSEEEDSSNQNLAGQTENEKKKVKKSPRNTQNSYRTITRALKKYAQKNWKISIEKFFQVEKPMNTLAILKKQAQAGRLTNVLGELANHKKFKQILSGSNVEEKKDQKVKKILQYLLNLTQQSFNVFQISDTLKKLSQIGQLKSHPIKNMSVEKLMQIQANFTLIK